MAKDFGKLGQGLTLQPLASAPSSPVNGDVYYDQTSGFQFRHSGAWSGLGGGGGSITNWTSYTPTFGAGFGTVTDINFWYREVGQDLEIRGFAKTGTVANATTTISLPGGYTIDTSLVKNAAAADESTLVGHLAQDGGASQVVRAIVNNNTASNVIGFAFNSGNTLTFTTAVNFLASSASFSVNISVPVV